MYHGPREEVVPFFKSLGFVLPPRKGVADFLQEITSRKEQKVGLGGAVPGCTLHDHVTSS